MRIVVAAIGRLKRGPETELAERYARRAAQTGRSLGLRDIETIEIRESRAAEAGKRMIEESIALANVIPQDAAVVLLDAGGENMDSTLFQSFIKNWLKLPIENREELDKAIPFIRKSYQEALQKA